LQVRRTIPPTLGISPKLGAGAVTSITERRTEPPGACGRVR
jgi:hypothetical protein